MDNQDFHCFLKVPDVPNVGVNSSVLASLFYYMYVEKSPFGTELNMYRFTCVNKILLDRLDIIKHENFVAQPLFSSTK